MSHDATSAHMDPLRRSAAGFRPAFARFMYELGWTRASGVLFVDSAEGRETFQVRGGAVTTSETDPLARRASGLLAKLAASESVRLAFAPDPSGRAQASPTRMGRPLPLDSWAREHLERELTVELSRSIARALDGARIAIRPGAALDRKHLDETDRLLVAALGEPRDLRDLAIRARVPRFRLLAFVHFLSSVGQLLVVPARSPSFRPPPLSSREQKEPALPKPAAAAFSPRASALRLLGLPPDADLTLVKGAYRRLARALHPDLHPGVNEAIKRDLERRLAHVNAAYFELNAG